ncbi:metapyrocatechase [Burkholderia lata]|uniref:Metapyrocatechase n=1 Tax=Burkholderia lata (strain ATCC 17760 / DSM 23089 / LMG 22485 / NCIMB 9086 / R18194 / 383) TaxID=482957 RepID=A0A6P2VWK2_BURL3|nr:VOC family protein [Burkholderia lata]VWC89463.1 metapyrocatechase [Burkholderia lata]
MNDFDATHARAAVHSIDHFALSVPSIEDAEHFFDAFGLDVVRTGERGDMLELRAGDGHRWARILPSDGKRLAYLSFNCFDADLAVLRDQVEAARAVIEPGASTDDSSGFWFSDPDGNRIQVKPGVKTTPASKARCVTHGVAADERGACTRSSMSKIRPNRLSHVLLFTPDVPRAVDFYERALGLRLSDRSADLIAFTHAPHGSDHHLIAFAKSPARGWHHSSWDVNNVDRVGEGAAQMATAGYVRGWGTGRHVLGSNYFHYVQDPWGSFCEYSADIDFVSAGSVWPTGNYPPEDSLYLWGPEAPTDFTRNTEASE